MTDVVLTVRVTPRSDRTEVDGVDDDGVLRVRVTAAPVDGAATEAVTRLIAAELRVPPSSVEIVSGASSRHKRLRVHDADPARVLQRWPGLVLGGGSEKRKGPGP